MSRSCSAKDNEFWSGAMYGSTELLMNEDGSLTVGVEGPIPNGFLEKGEMHYFTIRPHETAQLLDWLKGRPQIENCYKELEYMNSPIEEEDV